MAQYVIITNNPAVADKYPDTARLINAPVTAVLKKTRDAVHKGAALLSHPQTGGMRPGLSPYKSVIVSDTKSEVDFTSLRLIEETIAAYRKDAATKIRAYHDALLDDFKTVDLDLIDSAVSALN